VVEEMTAKTAPRQLRWRPATATADRVFLDSPKAEWLWEFAQAMTSCAHHPPMQSIGHDRSCIPSQRGGWPPFDSTVNGARMIASGVFDRHPKLQVLIVHMGGDSRRSLGASNSVAPQLQRD